MLIRKIEIFLRHTRMSAARFGRLATRDPQFVFDLRRGRTPRPETETRVEHFMNTYIGRNPMHIDTPALPRGPRRTSSERLREELQALARGHALITAHSEKSWASITFAGTRHRLDLAFEGREAVEAGERFIAYLPEHEFAIPRQLVADAAVTSVDHRVLPEPRMEVQVELLLLDEE